MRCYTGVTAEVLCNHPGSSSFLCQLLGGLVSMVHLLGINSIPHLCAQFSEESRAHITPWCFPWYLQGILKSLSFLAHGLMAALIQGTSGGNNFMGNKSVTHVRYLIFNPSRITIMFILGTVSPPRFTYCYSEFYWRYRRDGMIKSLWVQKLFLVVYHCSMTPSIITPCRILCE